MPPTTQTCLQTCRTCCRDPALPARCRARALEFSGAVYRTKLGEFAAAGYRRFREGRRP